MKSRAGFVSNSSSSSFVIHTDDVDAIIKTMKELKEKNISFNVSIWCGQYGDIADNISCQKILTDNNLEYDCEGDGNGELNSAEVIEELLSQNDKGDFDDPLTDEGVEFLKSKLMVLKNHPQKDSVYNDIDDEVV